MICGGGIIGAATAFYLSELGIRPTVIEREAVACAASGMDTGPGLVKAISLCRKGDKFAHQCQHPTLSNKAEKWLFKVQMGFEGLRLLWKGNCCCLRAG